MADIDFKYSDIDSLIPYAMNSRTHSDEQIAQIAASIREFGFLTPVLIDSSGNLIAGHGRLLASRKLGLKQIPSVVADGLTEAQRKAYVIADNKLALNAGWDEDLLRIELQSLVDMDFDISLTGFDDDFIRDLLVEENGGLTDPDDAPSVDDINQPVTQSGDIWLLGKHRLMCGDSTSIDAISELCQENLVDMWLTDPPYNVAYEGKTKDALTIKNDEMGDADFRAFLAAAYSAADSIMKPGAVFYIWHADSEGYNFRGAARDIGWKIRQCLIWQKNGMVLGRQDYHWQHEPCQPPGTLVRTPNGSVPIENLKNGDKVVSYNSYSGVITGMRDGREIKVASRHFEGELYGVCVGSKQTWTTDSHRFSVRFKDGASHLWASDRKQTTLLDFAKPTRNGEHPTMKPVGLFEYQMLNNTKGGDVILDSFGGSGTTLIAAEKNGRIARIMELDPKYCDVIIKRWQEFTGKDAILERNSFTFNELVDVPI